MIPFTSFRDGARATEKGLQAHDRGKETEGGVRQAEPTRDKGHNEPLHRHRRRFGRSIRRRPADLLRCGGDAARGAHAPLRP